jgi:hypothetical protein
MEQGQSELQPHSCNKCRIITIDGTKRGLFLEQKEVYTLEEVKSYAATCALFRWTLEFPDRNIGDQACLELSISTNSEDLGSIDVQWRNHTRATISETEKATLYIFAKEGSLKYRTCVQSLTNIGDVSAHYIQSRPLTCSTAEVIGTNKFRKLLERCAGHMKCRNAIKSSQLPTRVLQIDGYPDSREGLQLVELQDFVDYAALSYCWGDSQEKTKTTRENLKTQLPQTIKDAVKVARLLRFKYLWVDALCIVQDDDMDVAKELGKMSSIYYGATLTISAASAERSSEGFLGDRVLSKAYGGTLFSMNYQHCSENTVDKGSVLLSQHPIYDESQEPIDRRGWTLQEHILSRRILRFGSKQTTWKCLSEHYSLDGGGSPQPINRDPAFALDEVHRGSEVQSHMKRFGRLGTPFVLGDWQTQVEEYSRRSVTKLSDRLPACSALAKNVAEIVGWKSSDYLAGLWKKSVQEDLLWFRPDQSSGSISRKRHGPTWSWASLHGAVRFYNRSPVKEFEHMDAQAELKQDDIDLKMKSLPYSEVLSGRLTFDGRVRKAYWDGICLRENSSSEWALPLRICWDLPGDEDHGDVWCFEIFGSHGVDSESLGLVLERQGSSHYERLGFYQASCGFPSELVHTWFSIVQKTTIILS